jgi:hypothetical protein
LRISIRILATLTSLGVACVAGPASAGSGIKVSVLGIVTLPPVGAAPIGEAKVYRENAVVMSMPLAWRDTATLKSPTKVRVAGYDWSLASSDLLMRAYMVGAHAGEQSHDSIMYCAVEVRKKDWLKVTPGGAGIADRLADRFQLCLIDDDKDGAFDTALMVGAKLAADQVKLPINRVQYQSQKLVPVPGARLDMVYLDGTSLKPPSLHLVPYWDGVRASFTGMDVPGHARLANGKSMNWSPGAIWVKQNFLPETVWLDDGKLSVSAVDRTANTVTITIESYPTGFSFSLLNASVIFIAI